MNRIQERTNNQIAALEAAGAQEVKHYNLVSNEGYTFTKDGIAYDLRHWLNFYGEAMDFWSVGGNGNETDSGTFEEAIAFIKEL